MLAATSAEIAWLTGGTLLTLLLGGMLLFWINQEWRERDARERGRREPPPEEPRQP